jgi:glycosyltransferase involved in cell wall biosynthesis
LCFLAGTLGQGGAERQLFYALKCLSECGAEVSVLTFAKREYWEAPIRDLGVPVNFVGSSASRLKRLWGLVKQVRHLRPHILQGQHFHTSPYSVLAGRCLGIPSIAAVRSDGFSELQSVGWLPGRLSISLSDWIAANSQRAIDNLLSLGTRPAKILFIPNVVDTRRFRCNQESRSSNEFVILGIGSLEPVKRFDRLLEIAVGLAGQIARQVRVVIAGDGSQRELVASLAQRMKKERVKVDLVGRVCDPLPLYKSADVLLLTSDREGTPNVVMEAMACALPVVATNIGGIPDLVKEGKTGFLFDRADLARAIDALKRLASQPTLAADLGASSRSFIDRYHSLERLPAILAVLYEKALAQLARQQFVNLSR